MLNSQGYPLNEVDFCGWEDFEAHWAEVEMALGELEADVDGEEYLNAEQKKAIIHHLDGAVGNIYQAREAFQEMVEVKIEQSEKEFDAQEKAEEVGT
jgi:hypothetical protein